MVRIATARVEHRGNYSPIIFMASFEYVYGQLAKMDFGATLGAGLELSNLAPFRIDLEFQYSPNFTDSYSENHTKVRNNSWELVLVIGM
jgi:hypothetical protein